MNRGQNLLASTFESDHFQHGLHDVFNVGWWITIPKPWQIPASLRNKAANLQQVVRWPFLERDFAGHRRQLVISTLVLVEANYRIGQRNEGFLGTKGRNV